FPVARLRRRWQVAAIYKYIRERGRHPLSGESVNACAGGIGVFDHSANRWRLSVRHTLRNSANSASLWRNIRTPQRRGAEVRGGYAYKKCSGVGTDKPP